MRTLRPRLGFRCGVKLAPRRLVAPPDEAPPEDIGGLCLQRQSGFTLIEVMVVLVILPLVMGAVSVAIITSLRNDTGVSTKLSDSHDAQITSAYFVRDVQSSFKLSTGPSTPLCGTGNQVLGVESDLNPGPAIYVSYVTKMLGSSPALVRNFCRGSTTPSASTVAHDLAGISSADAMVTPTCALSDSTCASDAAAGPIPSVDVASIEITVTEVSGYQYSLTAAPRQISLGSYGASPPGSSPPTMLLLGQGQNVLNCNGSPGNTLTVNGIAATDSTSSNGDTVGGNSRMTGAEVYTGNSSTSVAAYTPTSTTPYASGPPIPDPYANLPDPNTSTMTAYTTTSSVPGPGDYKNAVALTHSQTLSSGIYVFEQGLSISGNPSVTVTGSNVLLFIGIPNAAPSTPQPAVYSVTGNGTINFTAMTTGTYAGIVIFQSRTDSNTLNIAGNGTSTTYTGVIYAPDAQVNTSGNGTTATSGVIAQSLACGGNGGVTIGSTVPTTTTVTSSSAVPTSGQSVTFTASVSATDNLVPAGSVTFKEAPNGSSTSTTMCSNVTLTNGTARCTTMALTAGANSPYSVSATYTGNATFQSSTGTMSQPVYTATTTTVSAQPASPTSGQQVVLTASVAPAPDGGTVAWNITYGSGNSLTCNSTTTLSGGSATCTVSAGILQAANSPYTVTATYSGDPLYATSTGTLRLSVGQGSSTTTATAVVTSSGSSEGATDMATVAGASGIPPTGTVTFYICANTTSGCSSSTQGAMQVGTATSLSSGQASSASYPVTSGSSYCFAAYYGGDSNYLSSSDTSIDQCFTAS